jgi:hypothetical protein
LVEHGRWSLDREGDGRAAAAARRLAAAGVDLLAGVDPAGSRALALDEPLDGSADEATDDSSVPAAAEPAPAAR